MHKGRKERMNEWINKSINQSINASARHGKSKSVIYSALSTKL
jgi:hypothetical protein